MRRIMLSFVACPALPYFQHHLKNGTIFRKKDVLNMKCVLIFSKLLSETFLVLKRIQSDVINAFRFSYKVCVIVRF